MTKFEGTYFGKGEVVELNSNGVYSVNRKTGNIKIAKVSKGIYSVNIKYITTNPGQQDTIETLNFNATVNKNKKTLTSGFDGFDEFAHKHDKLLHSFTSPADQNGTSYSGIFVYKRVLL